MIAGGQGDTPRAVEKGLRPHAIGLFGATVLGVVNTAPGYSLAVTLGLLATSVGRSAPVLIVFGFIPVLCMTIAQQELVSYYPDAGTVFVWVGRTFGPYLGWIAGFAYNTATLIAMANLTSVAGIYTLLLVGADAAATCPAATIAVGCCWLVAATWLGIRDISVWERAQTILLGLSLGVLILFATIAAVRIAAGTAGGQSIAPSLSWLNPLAGHDSEALGTGMLLTIFLFWGWDAPAAVAEESDTETRAPRVAMMISALTLLATFLVIAVITQMFAGTGIEGIGLANSKNNNDVLGPIGVAVAGHWFATMMHLEIGRASCRERV